jgi:hypothetical protein
MLTYTTHTKVMKERRHHIPAVTGFNFDLGHVKIHWRRSGGLEVAGALSYLPN